MESLDVYAEIGAALAGFATIAGVLREDINHRHNAFGVVQSSLFVMLFALLPGLVGDLRVSALLFLLGWSALWTVTGVRNHRFHRAVVALPQPVAVTASAFVFACGGSVLAALVVADVWPERALAFYAWCLMCGLATASLFLSEVARTLFISEPPPPAE